MVIFVFGSMIVGMIATGAALISGFSLLAAFWAYIGGGTLIMALVLIRALICLKLNAPDNMRTRTT